MSGKFIGRHHGYQPLGNGKNGSRSGRSTGNTIVEKPGFQTDRLQRRGRRGDRERSGRDVAGNRVSGNSIHNNGGLGLDLVGDGVTLNDPGDPDTGPNDLQNFPALSSAVSDGITTQILGTLDSLPATTFAIELSETPPATLPATAKDRRSRGDLRHYRRVWQSEFSGVGAFWNRQSGRYGDGDGIRGQHVGILGVRRRDLRDLAFLGPDSGSRASTRAGTGPRRSGSPYPRRPGDRSPCSVASIPLLILVSPW